MRLLTIRRRDEMLEDLVRGNPLENILYGDIPNIRVRLDIPKNALVPRGNKVNVRVIEGAVILNHG